MREETFQNAEVNATIHFDAIYISFFANQIPAVRIICTANLTTFACTEFLQSSSKNLEI